MARKKRKRLPATQTSVTHKTEIEDYRGQKHEVYITVGLYKDETPGELFIVIGKEGSTIRGVFNTVGILTSFLLQYGIPLEEICRKMEGMKYEPLGPTNNPEVAQCASITDYIFTWLRLKFGEETPVGSTD